MALRALAFGSIFLLCLISIGSSASWSEWVDSNLDTFKSEWENLPIGDVVATVRDVAVGIGSAVKTAIVEGTTESAENVVVTSTKILFQEATKKVISLPLKGAVLTATGVAFFTTIFTKDEKARDSQQQEILDASLSSYILINKFEKNYVEKYANKYVADPVAEYAANQVYIPVAKGDIRALCNLLTVPLCPPPSSDMLNHDGPEGSDISDIGSLTGEGSSGSSSSSPSTPPSITPTPGSSQVMVNIWIHCSDKPNLPAKGTKVTAIDGAGNAIQVELDSNGKATVYGEPGTWTIKAKATMYKSDPWSVDVPIGTAGYADIYQIFSPPIWIEGSQVAGVGTLV